MEDAVHHQHNTQPTTAAAMNTTTAAQRRRKCAGTQPNRTSNSPPLWMQKAPSGRRIEATKRSRPALPPRVNTAKHKNAAAMFSFATVAPIDGAVRFAGADFAHGMNGGVRWGEVRLLLRPSAKAARVALAVP